MFQKSLRLLLALGMLLLLGVVAFAFLDRTGPDDYLAAAERLIARGELARAIALLDRAEHAPRVQRVPARRERLLRLRYDAYTRLGNANGALRDVDLLLRDLPGDETLQLDRIRLLALDGKGTTAVQAALQFLERHPGHGRALELAGEASQSGYQPALAALLELIARELPAADQAAARGCVWSHVFRPAGDPEIAVAEQQLAAFFARDARLTTLWQSTRNDLAAVRRAAQEALGWFRQSLEGAGTPVAAFRAFALSLDQSRRIDDLLVLCEIYRRRFNHEYVDEAGASAAWALLRDEQYAAAAAVCDRWLTSRALDARIAAQRVGQGTIDLLVARAWAAWRSESLPLARAAWRDVDLLRKVANFDAVPITAAVLQLLGREAERAERSLGFAVAALARASPPVDRLDLLPAFATALLDLQQERGTGDDAQQQVLRTWRQARPRSIDPLLAQAEHLLARGQLPGALATIEDARVLAPTDPRLFPAYLAVMRRHAASFGHDGDTLLAQCLRLRTTLPEVRQPIGYLFCGEAALAQQKTAIALRCARAAVDAFPNAAAPRLLLVRAQLAAGNARDAASSSLDLVRLLPPDGETADLALQAHRQADADVRPLLAALLPAPVASSSLTIALLREALRRSPATAVAFVPDDRTTSPPLRALAAHALAAAGDAAAAAALLDAPEAFAASDAAPLRADLAQAFAALCRAAAPTTDDGTLEVITARRLVALRLDDPAAVPALLAAAAALAPSHPRTALLVQTRALAAATPEQRDGASLILHGELLLRAKRYLPAAQAWTAALAFADGAAVAERLLRLCLALERDERAQAVAGLVAKHTDAALAAWCGASDAARELLSRDVLADPADLATHCLLALSSEVPGADWPRVTGEELQQRLELLALLREPALAPFLEARVQALIAREGPSRTNRLLLARARAAQGDGALASALHATLEADGKADLVLFREVALAASVPGYALPPTLSAKLQVASTAGQLAPSPTTLAFALRQMEDSARPAAPAIADQLRLSTWLLLPQHAPLGGADLELVTRRHRPADAWFIIDQALTGPWASDRPALLDALHRLGDELLRTETRFANPIGAAARRYLASDGPRGSIVHLLLRHGDRLGQNAPRGDARKELLLQHLTAVADGRDCDEWLPSTVQMLVAIEGVSATVARLDALLREQPTATALWRERTRVLVGTHDARQAVDQLRMVLARGASPDHRLMLLALAGEVRATRLGDDAAFAALPLPLRESPAGRAAAAWLALRQGRADEALAHFGAAPDRADGMHLFGRGLAALQSSSADAIATARAAFEQLARDYASSSAARNAGSFARQLAGR